MVGHLVRTLTLAATCVLSACAVSAPPAPPQPVAAAPVPVRVVVVSTFEIGQDTGDAPGEFQHWVEGLPLTRELPFPAGYHPIRYNPDLQVIGIVSGEGPQRMAASITALGHDPRFDLSHAYFLLAGIGGIDPNTGSVGSAVWAPHVVDGAFAHEIDAREIPRDWPDGFTPMQRDRPDGQPVMPADTVWGTGVYTIDPGLLGWAYQLTRNVPLPDTPTLVRIRAEYRQYPAAQQPPSVTLGDTMASPIFWIGKRMNAHAERWVRYWTQGQGRFVTTAEEDAGFMEAMTFLSRAGLVDLHRVLVLRSASNYDMPPDGQSAASLLAAEVSEKGFSGFIPSLAAAYDAGSVVVRELATHWDRYGNQIPGHGG